MSRQAYIKHSVLNLLPNPEVALKPVRDNEEMQIRYIGGLHNLSYPDKLRWRDDVRGNNLLLVETAPSDRGEFYPDADTPINAHGYNIQYISFQNRGDDVVIHSHNKNHVDRHPIAAVAFVAGTNRPVAQEPVLVWMKEGRLHTVDFMEATVNTHNFSVHCKQFVRFYPKHDFLDRILIRDLQEVWEDDFWIASRFSEYQVITKGSRTPESGDPSTQDWIEEHCKSGFDLLSDEPFQDEQEEFHFLTDLVL